MEIASIVLSILIGLLVGRWWSVVLALPVAVIAANWFSFEGFSGLEVGVLFGVVVVLDLVVGTAARKGLGVLSGHRQMRR